MDQIRKLEQAAGIALGDNFYVPTVVATTEEQTCDWCGGDYRHVLPTGNTLSCTYCTWGKTHKQVWNKPSVQIRTAGQITLKGSRSGCELILMAVETGVGSGQLYIWGKTAFATPKEARERAEEMVAEKSA